MNKESLDHITDQELLDRFYVDHRNEWLGVLLQRYILLIFGVCMKYLKNEEESKDAAQQINLKALTELQKYRVTYFSSWIYTVTRNYCLMKLRGQTTMPRKTSLENLTLEDTGYSEKNTFFEREKLLETMSQTLEELNHDQKDCVTLFYLHKMSYSQIAEQLGITQMQVKSHIQNGKRNLKILLDRKINNHT